MVWVGEGAIGHIIRLSQWGPVTHVADFGWSIAMRKYSCENLHIRLSV